MPRGRAGAYRAFTDLSRWMRTMWLSLTIFLQNGFIPLHIWVVRWMTGHLPPCVEDVQRRNREEDDDVQKIIQEADTEIEKLKSKHVREKQDDKANHDHTISLLRRQIGELQQEKNAAEAAEKEALRRLSENISSRLRDNNPNIVDLNDLNRPTKLAEMSSELYDNEWTTAYSCLEDKFTEPQCIALLLDVVMECSIFCHALSTEHSGTVTKWFIVNMDKNGAKEKMKWLKDVRKINALSMLPEVAQACIGHLVEKTNLKDIKDFFILGSPVQKYVQECVKLGWLMAVQDPPVVMACPGWEQKLPKKNDNENVEEMEDGSLGKQEEKITPTVIGNETNNEPVKDKVEKDDSILDQSNQSSSDGKGRTGVSQPLNRDAGTDDKDTNEPEEVVHKDGSDEEEQTENSVQPNNKPIEFTILDKEMEDVSLGNQEKITPTAIGNETNNEPVKDKVEKDDSILDQSNQSSSDGKGRTGVSQPLNRDAGTDDKDANEPEEVVHKDGSDEEEQTENSVQPNNKPIEFTILDKEMEDVSLDNQEKITPTAIGNETNNEPVKDKVEKDDSILDGGRTGVSQPLSRDAGTDENNANKPEEVVHKDASDDKEQTEDSVQQNTEPIEFNKSEFKEYTKHGKFVKYVVWPLLYLHEKGQLLSKGVAQGYD